MLMANSASASGKREPHDVFCVDVSKWKAGPEEVGCLMGEIQEPERARCERFRMDIDKRRSLVGRILLRWMTHVKTGLAWRSILFGRTKDNKPYFIDPSEEKSSFNLNVSHHGNWVAGASSTEAIVGVDVMRYERPRGCKSIPDFFETMRQYFSAHEWECIEGINVEVTLSNSAHATDTANLPQNATRVLPSSSPPSSSTPKIIARKQNCKDIKEGAKLSTIEFSQLRKFYLHWALKESYIKAIGVGLGFDLSRAEFRFADDGEQPSEVLLYIDGVRQHQWTFSIFEPDAEHCVVVALGPFSDAAPHFQEVLAPPNLAVHGQSGKQYDDEVEFHIRTVAELKET